MTDWLGLEKLRLSKSRPRGYVPTPTASQLERVRNYGPIEPVVVRPIDDDRFEILANAETWVAAGRAGFHEVPVLIRDDIDEDRVGEIVRSHYGSNKRNAIDEAKHFESELEMFGGQTCRGAVGQLAIAISRPRPYIVHSLRLLTLPPEIQDLIERGTLSAGQARPLVSLGNRATQLRAAQEIIDNKMSAREAEKLARKLKSGKTVNDENQTTQVAGKSADTKHFERQVSEVIGTPFSLENGRAIIDYSGNLEVLQGIVERLGFRGS